MFRRPSGFLRRAALGLLLALGVATPAYAIDAGLTLAQLHHAAWSTRQGAPAQVESMAQTDDGLLWLGTATGLFTFDGLQFERFAPPADQAPPSAAVSTLFVAPRAGLWIGYRFGGLGWWKDGRLRLFGTADGLPPGTVTAVAIDAQGLPWVATANGIAHYDGRRWAAPPGASPALRGMTYAIHVDRAGAVWAVAEDGTWRWRPGDARFERSTRSVSFAWLAQRADGTLWESNGTQGVWQLPATDGAPPLRPAEPGPGRVGPLLFDRDGPLWLGTSAGVLRLPTTDALARLEADGTPRVDPALRFTRADGLSGDQVLALLEDREGDVWVSTNGGLDRFRATKLTRAPLPSDLFWPSIAPASGGGVWVGSTETGAARIGSAPMRLPGVGPRVTSVLRDSQGAVWMGGARGLWRIVGDVARPVPLPREMAGMPVQAMVDAGGGRLRLALLHRGQWEQDAAGDGWHPVPEPGEPSGAGPLAMLKGRGEQLWLGYPASRVVRVDIAAPAHPLQAWSDADGLRVGGVLSLLAQGDRVWVGGELGLAAIVDGRVRVPLFAGDAPPTGVSGLVVDDASGDLWLNTAQGIFRLPAADIARALRDPAARVAAERLDFRDGLDGAPAQLRPVPTAVAGLDGRLWFSTNNSLVWIDPRRIRRNDVAPGVQIRQFSAAGRDWPLAGAALPTGTREIDLRYTASALAQPERVRFRVRLVGVDADWRDVGTQRVAHYSNLAPGRYEFDVQAANEDGLWSRGPASLAFDLPPSIFQTTWFRLLCLPPALALAWWLMRWRVHRLAQRFADRQEAMLVERERIARDLHDTLLQSVQGLILRLQANVNRMATTDPVRGALERTVDRAEQVLTEARGQVTGLRDRRSRGVPLGRALAQAGDELALEHQRGFTAVVPEHDTALPDDLHEEVLHVGLEALRNAFRHAGAAQVRLTLRRTATLLVLEIADDGRGISRARERVAKHDGHWGLSGMRERAHAIGARLHVDSTPGDGTRVRLHLRLRRAARRPHLPWSTP